MRELFCVVCLLVSGCKFNLEFLQERRPLLLFGEPWYWTCWNLIALGYFFHPIYLCRTDWGFAFRPKNTFSHRKGLIRLDNNSTGDCLSESNKKQVNIPKERLDNSTGDCLSESNQNQVNIPKERLAEAATTSTTTDRCGSDQIQQRSESWKLRIEEIDPSVIDELPKEIQDEIQAWLRPSKRPHRVKRGFTIADYFSPSKNR